MSCPTCVQDFEHTQEQGLIGPEQFANQDETQ